VNFYVAPSLRSAEPVSAPVPPPAAPLPAPARAPQAAPAPARPEPEEAIAQESGEESAVEAPPPLPKKSSSLALVAGIAAVVILGGAAAAFFMMKKGDEAPPPAPATVEATTVAPKPAPAPAPPPPPTDTAPRINPSEVFLAEIVVEPPAAPATTETTTAAPAVPPDPKLVATANDIRAIAGKIIMLEPSLTFVEAAAPTSRRVGGIVRKSDAGVVLVPTLVEGSALTEGDAIALPAKAKDNYEPALALARWMASKLGKDLAPFLSANAAATKAYVDAVAQQRAGDDAKAVAAAKKAVAADPKYLSAQKLLHSLYTKSGSRDDAYKVATTIATLDPANLGIREELARAEAERGNAPKALSYLSALLSAKDDDPEILTLLGDYALAVADEGKFQTVVARLATVRAPNPRLHEADLSLARGRVDSSVKAYYKAQETQQDNPWLSLKIGKLAVIRRSDSIVELEKARQQRLGDPYTLPMMNAFIAAGRNDAATADAEIAKAESAAVRAHDHYTLVAEINVLLNRQRQVIAALDSAVARSEPSLTYIVSSPLFAYLETDPRFTKLKRVIREKTTQLSAALKTIAL
jgi:tetratricopeptide (TPR) repeat protein